MADLGVRDFMTFFQKFLQHHKLTPPTENPSFVPICLLCLLPPANEVWGKVMFSEACVSHSVHRGWGVSVWFHFLSGYLVPCSFQGVSVPSHTFLCPEGGLYPWRSLFRRGSLSRGVSLERPPTNLKSGWYTSYWILSCSVWFCCCTNSAEALLCDYSIE